MFSFSKILFFIAMCVMTIPSYPESNKTQDSNSLVFFHYMGLVYGAELTRNNVYCWSPVLEEARSIWHSENLISDVVSDHGSNLIAFLEIKTADRTGLGKFSTLRVIKQDGSLVSTIRKEHAVQEFAWSPTGKEIAFSLGDDAEVGSFYDPKGVYVYNIETEKTKQISEYGRGLYWARFDGRLYYLKMDKNYNQEVFAYDFREKSEKKTNYRSTDFSRNGTYYYVLAGDPTLPSELYECATNKSVTDRSESPVSPLALIRMHPSKWIDDRHLLSRVPRNDWSHVFFLLDADTGRIRRTDNFILQEYSPGVVVVQKPDGSFGLEEIDSMTEVQPEDLPKTLDEVRAEQKAEKKNPTPK